MAGKGREAVSDGALRTESASEEADSVAYIRFTIWKIPRHWRNLAERMRSEILKTMLLVGRKGAGGGAGCLTAPIYDLRITIYLSKARKMAWRSSVSFPRSNGV